MELLEDAIRKRQFKEVLLQCEEGEILNPSGYATPELYAIMLGCYLAIDELEHAKFLWIRIPDSFKKDNPFLVNLWSVGIALKQRDMGKFRQTVAEVTWPDNFLTLIDVITECVTERKVVLISKSYSTIHVEHMGNLLGLTADTTRDISKKIGWTMDEGTGIISPVVKHLEQRDVVKGKEIIEHLSNYVSFLEN